jgi:pantetheine-phosphate adenylyltransferase
MASGTPDRNPRTSCVYAGSFDPFTYGHLSVVLNARRVFDEVHVLVAVNPAKTGLFAPAERVALIRDVLRDVDGVTVGSTEGYVVVYARRHGYGHLVRGLRGMSDVKDEMALAAINAALAPDVNTVFIPTNPVLETYSSSRVRELHAKGESVSLLVPPEVVKALAKKGSGVRSAT